MPPGRYLQDTYVNGLHKVWANTVCPVYDELRALLEYHEAQR